MITEAKLKFWIDNNLNVLFVGEHGVGKTARVKQAFDKAGLNWLYFSAATLDPWVDFIGIPKETEDPETGIKYIDLVRPKPFAEDTVEAIFIDELNRSHKKVRNAVMELVQFKSINGKPFRNLRIIWGAINPETRLEDSSELEYDVERLDPAQKDRFEIHVDVPFAPDRAYFLSKHGPKSEAAMAWWKDLPPNVQKLVSPRRLDYALGVVAKGGDIRDVLPPQVNCTKLLQELNSYGVMQQVMEICKAGNAKKAKEFLSVRNNFDAAIDKVLKDEQLTKFYLPLVDEEDVTRLAAKDKQAFNHVVNDANVQGSRGYKIIANTLTVSPNSGLAKKFASTPVGSQILAEQRLKDREKLSFSKFSSIQKVNLEPYTLYHRKLSSILPPGFDLSFQAYCKAAEETIAKGRNNTYHRMGMLAGLKAHLNDSMQPQEYEQAFKTMSLLMGNFQNQVIRQHKFMVGYGKALLGYLFHQVMKSRGLGFTEACKLLKPSLKVQELLDEHQVAYM